MPFWPNNLIPLGYSDYDLETEHFAIERVWPNEYWTSPVFGSLLYLLDEEQFAKKIISFPFNKNVSCVNEIVSLKKKLTNSVFQKDSLF